MPCAAVRLALLCALALCASACVHLRLHEEAPTTARPEDLADYVIARIRPSDLHSPRTLQVSVAYQPGEIDPLGTAESICVELVPLWPCARGQWPVAEAPALGPVLERILAPHFRVDPAAAPDVLVEVVFTPDTYRRYTRTIYGLSLWGGVSLLLGYPTTFSTVVLDAEVRVHDLRRGDPQGKALFERRVRGVATSCNGTFLYFFVYNAVAPSPLLHGKPPVVWEDITAESLQRFASALLDALAEAFPRRCVRCKLDYEPAATRCDRCGAEL